MTFASRPFVKILCKGRFLSMSGFTMFFTSVFGGGHALKLALLVLGMSLFLLTSLYDIVEGIPREKFDEVRTLRYGRWEGVWEVVVLGRMDVVLDTIRQNAAMGWFLVTTVEGLVRFEGGVGAMMLVQDKVIRLDGVFAIQLLVLLVGILQDVGLSFLRRTTCKHAYISLERQ